MKKILKLAGISQTWAKYCRKHEELLKNLNKVHFDPKKSIKKYYVDVLNNNHYT